MIYDINGNQLESHYGSDGTAKAYAFDIRGNILIDGGSEDSSVFRDLTVVTNVYTSSITMVAEGGCIDDEANVYTCFYQGKFVKYNLLTGTETQYDFTSGAYGHANGMAYNPNTGYLYVASMQSTGEVYVFDKSLNLVDTKYARDAVGIRYTVWNIAYDRTQRLFISLVDSPTGQLHFYDDDMNHVLSIPIDASFWSETAQDIETDGEYIYCVSHNPKRIHVLSMQGNHLKTIDNSDFNAEPESMMYRWETGDYYMEGFGAWTVKHLDIKK